MKDHRLLANSAIHVHFSEHRQKLLSIYNTARTQVHTIPVSNLLYIPVESTYSRSHTHECGFFLSVLKNMRKCIQHAHITFFYVTLITQLGFVYFVILIIKGGKMKHKKVKIVSAKKYKNWTINAVIKNE